MRTTLQVILVLVLAIVLQAAVLPAWQIGRYRADLLALLAGYLIFHVPVRPMPWVAMGLGLVCDSTGDGPFGLRTALFTIAACLMERWQPDFPTPRPLSAAVLAACLAAAAATVETLLALHAAAAISTTAAVATPGQATAVHMVTPPTHWPDDTAATTWLTVVTDPASLTACATAAFTVAGWTLLACVVCNPLLLWWRIGLRRPRDLAAF